MAEYVGQGEAQMLAGSSQDRSVCSTGEEQGEGVCVVEYREGTVLSVLDKALSYSYNSGKCIADKLNQDINSISDIVIKNFPKDSVVMYKSSEMLSKRTWILTGSENFKNYVAHNDMYKDRGILVLDRLVDKDYNYTVNPPEERARDYRQVISVYPNVMDIDTYQFIVTNVSPVRFVDGCDNDCIIPAISKTNEGKLRLETQSQGMALTELMFSPCTTSGYLKRWFRYTNDRPKDDKLPLNYYLSRNDFDVVFEACNGIEEEEEALEWKLLERALELRRARIFDSWKRRIKLVNGIINSVFREYNNVLAWSKDYSDSFAYFFFMYRCESCAGEIDEVDFKRDRAKHIRNGKKKDKTKVPDHVINARKLKTREKFLKEVRRVPPQSNKSRVEDYEVVLAKLNKLSKGASIAVSCSWTEDAVEFFNEKFSDTKILANKAVSFVEQMGLLLFTCKQSKDFAGIASAVALWLVTRFSGNKSCILSGFKILCDFLGSENVNKFVEVVRPFEDFSRDLDSLVGSPYGFGETKESEGATCCNGMEYEEISSAFKSACFLGQTETMVRLQDFVGILAKLGCCSIFGYEFSPTSPMMGFSKFMYATQFYDVVVGHVTYFIERIWAAYEERDPRALLGCDDTSDILLKVQDLENIVKTINSNTTMLDPVTIDKLELDIDMCAKRLARAAHSASGPVKGMFLRGRQSMLDIKVDMARIRESGANVVPAFGIVNFGVTGQGKSSLTDSIISGLLAEHFGETPICGYQTMQGSEKWDQAQPGFRACVLEELAATNPDKEMSPDSIARVLRFINPARTPAMSAEAEKKGSLLPKYSIVVASTNVKDFHAGTWLSHPSAALRRFKFYITTRADPKYTDRGILSAAKVPGDKAPWLLTLQHYVTVFDETRIAPQQSYDHSAFNQGVKGYFETVVFEGKQMKDVDFNTAYRCISAAFRVHRLQEGLLNNQSTLLRQMGICAHSVPFTYCEDPVCIDLKKQKLVKGIADKDRRTASLEKQLERYDKPSFMRRFAFAQSTAGDEKRTVFGLFGGKPTVEKIVECVRRSGLQTISFKHVALVAREWGKEISEAQFASALQLQKWHVTNVNEQGEKFFQCSVEERNKLLCDWRSLHRTIFNGIRAPFRTGDFPRDNYVPNVTAHGDLYHIEDEERFEECKKLFEIGCANSGYLEWKKKNKLLGFFVDTILVKSGFSVDKDNWMLNSIASAFDAVNSRVNPWLAILMLLCCSLFVPWTLFFVIPMSVLFAIAMLVSKVCEQCLLFWSVFNPMNYTEVIRVRAKEYIKNRYAQVGAAVLGSLMAGSVAYSLYYRTKREENEACGSEFSKPKEVRPGFNDMYQRPIVHSVREYTKLGPNNTLEQATSLLANSLYVLRMSSRGTKLEDGIGITFSNCILTGMFAIANRHSFYGLGEDDPHEQIEIEVFQSRNMQPRCKCFVVKDDVEPFGDDFVIVRLFSIVPSYDLFKESNSLFPEKKVDLALHCTWMCRNASGVLEKEVVYASPSKVVYEDRRNSIVYNYPGYGFKLKEAKKGQCMAILVSHTNPFVVVGVHTAGHVGHSEALAGRITRQEVVDAIERYNARQVMPTACVGDIEVDPFNTGDYELKPLTKDACVNYVPVELGVSNCLVYGQVPGLVNQRQRTSKVKYTSIGEKMERLHPEYEVSIPINLHPRGFQQNLNKCAVQTSCGRRKAIQWAEDSLVEYYFKQIDKLDQLGETNFERDVHPVPIFSVFNDGVSGFNTVDLTKSAGYGLRGKKRAYMEEPMGIEESVLPMPLLEKSVEEMFEKCKKGIIPSSIHTGSLKRELLPKSKCYIEPPFEIVYTDDELEDGQVHISDVLKKKVRFFAGCSFPYLICCKMMFGMLLRYFTLYSVVFGMALGLNLHSYDFTILVKSWTVFGAAIVAGDYEKFDKKLNAVVTSTSARVIVRLLKRAGYNEELIRICSCLLYDVIYPVYIWSGVILRLAQTTPSGHPLTLFKNNIDNQICLRYCWYRVFEDMNMEVPCFDEFVVINTVGDDHIGTVSPIYPQYNLQSIAHYMLEIGMVYTAADKSELVNVYEDFDKIEYLKMRATWDDRLGVYKPLLNKASIYKMITKTLATFAEGSPAMEEHTLEVLKEAFHCMYYYGETAYNEFLEEVRSCIDPGTFKYVICNLPTFSDEDDSYKVRLKESNTVKLDTDFVIPREWDS